MSDGLRVNVGCPHYCEGWTCIDLHPQDRFVLRAEVTDWLSKYEREFDEIKAENLIEHLPNVGVFFKAAHDALKLGGVLTIVTDNAEWLPFYVPLLNMLGWGAHSSVKYHPILDGSQWHKTGLGHYCVFTKLHLANFALRYGFQIISVKRVMYGARLRAVLVAI